MGGKMSAQYYADYYRANKAHKRDLNRDWVEANQAAYQQYHATYYRANWARCVINRCKSRASRLGLEFSITPADIVLPAVCPILGIPLAIGGGDAAPSVDRVDSSKGYTPDNIQVISKRANTLKSDATAEELRLVAAYLDRRIA